MRLRNPAIWKAHPVKVYAPRPDHVTQTKRENHAQHLKKSMGGGVLLLHFMMILYIFIIHMCFRGINNYSKHIMAVCILELKKA